MSSAVRERTPFRPAVRVPPTWGRDGEPDMTSDYDRIRDEAAAKRDAEARLRALEAHVGTVQRARRRPPRNPGDAEARLAALAAAVGVPRGNGRRDDESGE